MPIIDNLLDGAALVARQATSLATSAATAATSPATSASTTASSTTIPDPTTTASTPPATTTSSSSNSPNGSSPLLFFVALGFGVVFTNLWIIVGVKYCFRYNARARQMRLAAEEGDQINMENMPHPRRRRREKKLMSIDEVNEKFPMMKYKTWVASRALNGLPTRGGVDAPSRPASVRSAAGAIAPVEPSTPKQPETTITTQQSDTANTPKQPETTTTTENATPDDPQTTSLYTKDTADEHDHERQSDDDDDEHIDSALPPECVGTSGDTCAICIDTLEDDDDVRGLTCGHAFHAVCLDPWLTSRRACCPLCKADYYTPKPRAQPADANAAAANADGQRPAIGIINVDLESSSRHRNHRSRRSPFPAPSFSGMRGPASYLPSILTGPRSAARGAPAEDGVAQPQPAASRSWFRRRQDRAPEVSEAPASAPAPAAAPATANADVTPSQLEAGIRS